MNSYDSYDSLYSIIIRKFDSFDTGIGFLVYPTYIIDCIYDKDSNINIFSLKNMGRFKVLIAFSVKGLLVNQKYKLHTDIILYDVFNCNSQLILDNFFSVVYNCNIGCNFAFLRVFDIMRLFKSHFLVNVVNTKVGIGAYTSLFHVSTIDSFNKFFSFMNGPCICFSIESYNLLFDLFVYLNVNYLTGYFNTICSETCNRFMKKIDGSTTCQTNSIEIEQHYLGFSFSINYSFWLGNNLQIDDIEGINI